MISTLSILGMLGLAQPVLGLGIAPAPVGGVVTAVNKLTIVAPYLVLAGIVAVASVIYIKKRRH
jgi:hypothetical protein